MKDNEHDENVVTDDSSHLESVNQYGDSNYIDDGEVNQEQRLSDKSLTEEIFVTLPTIASTQKPQNDSAYSEKISKRMNGRTLRLGDAKGEYYKSISYDDGASQQKINYNSYIPSSSLTSNYEASHIKPSSMPFNKDNEQTELRTDPNIQFDTHKNINLDRGSDPIAKDSFIQESNVETNKRGFEPESEYKNNYRLESKEEGNGTFREGYEDLEYENSGSESTEDEKEKFIQMSEEDEYKQESEEEEKDYIKHSSVQNEDASLNKEYNEQLEEHGNFKDKLDIIDDQSQFDHKYENKFREEASKVKSRTPKISKHKIQLYQSKLSKRRYHERPGSINDHSDRYDKNDNYGRESNLENEENYSQRDNNSDNEDYQYDSDYADDYNFHNKGLEQKFNSRKDKHYKRERKQEDEHGRHHSYDKNYKHEPDLEENERYPQNGDLSENKHGDRSQNRISFHDRDKYNKRGYDPDDGGGGMYHHSSHRHNKREPVLDSDRKNSLSDDFSDERYRQDSDYVEDDYGHSSKKIHPISEDHDKSYYDEKEYDGKYRLYSEENSLEKERSNSMNNKHYYGGLKPENQNVSISGKEGKSLRSYHEKDRYMNDQLGNNKRHRYKEISHKDNHHHRIQDDLENKNSHPP
nr:putative uncharacterized protein DDB_G0282133 [Lepeophtheirus salmonis]XP_040574318.1 putative uncharacterized protein DDB_G0282133 [Lepeophtheirus salmonis]XP_040574319.1 putative uncharacterized protein DDB_G0282133 [Lepeophtheirus salmonis]